MYPSCSSFAFLEYSGEIRSSNCHIYGVGDLGGFPGGVVWVGVRVVVLGHGSELGTFKYLNIFHDEFRFGEFSGIWTTSGFSLPRHVTSLYISLDSPPVSLSSVYPQSWRHHLHTHKSTNVTHQ